MAKARKLPSGNWRIQVYDNSTGKRLSFTSDTKRGAELLAAEWLSGKKQAAKTEKTVGECIKEYIESKENILSPSSVRKYYLIYNNAISGIADICVSELTEIDLQKWVNSSVEHYAPKSIKVNFGLVQSALKFAKIPLDFDSVLLPRIIPKEKHIPTEQEISQILHAVDGTPIELPVTIAVTLGLRQEEIAALKWSDYDGERLNIHATMVLDKYNCWIIQERTKSDASRRILEVGTLLKSRLDRAERQGEYISTMKPSSVLKAFKRLCKRNGIPEFTMHEQRRGNASMMLAKGIPDKYAMKRLGQASPNMIKNVYQHLYESKEKEAAQTMSETFDKIYNK